MRITREALKDALKHLIVPTKTTVPVLAYVKVEPGRLASTDLDVYTAVAVSDSESTKTFLVPLAALVAAAKGKGPQDIIRLAPNVITLPDKSQVNFTAPPVDDFPLWPTFDTSPPAADLPGDIVPTAALAARVGTDHDTRYYLQGALLEAGRVDHTFTLVATDGHRLVYRSVKHPSARLKKWPEQVLLHPLAVRWLAGQDPSDTITVAAGVSHVFLRAGRHSLFARHQNGQFPTWKRVALISTHHSVAFAREDLLRIVTSAKSCANARTHSITLSFSATETTVDASNGDGSSFKTTIAAKTTHAGKRTFRVRLNAEYLIDFLRGVDKPLVHAAFATPEKLKHSDPTGTLIQHQMVWSALDTRYVIMPMRT